MAKRAKVGPVTVVQQNVKANASVTHIFASQAESIRMGTERADSGLKTYIGEVMLKKWVKTEVADGLTPLAAMQRAADVAAAYATPAGTDVVAASQLRVVLEAARNGLSLAAVGKVIGDIKLRNDPKVSTPAKAFAEVLTRACRVVTDICDDAKVSAADAKKAGLRLSTRQAVQSIRN